MNATTSRLASTLDSYRAPVLLGLFLVDAAAVLNLFVTVLRTF